MPCRGCNQSGTSISDYNSEVETYGIILYNHFKEIRNDIYLSCQQCYEDDLPSKTTLGLLIKRRL